MPADQPAPAKAPARKRTATSVAKPTAAKGARKPAITPSPGSGEGAVLTAVATDGAPIAVVDAGEGLTIDETVVTTPDGVAEAPTDSEVAPAAEELMIQRQVSNPRLVVALAMHSTVPDLAILDLIKEDNLVFTRPA